MRTTKKLALIALGYALSVAGGLALAALNEMMIPVDISQTSGGMVAFGGMVVFIVGTGFFSLVPTWFLLALAAEQAPRALLAVLLLIAVTGPLSWLLVVYLEGAHGPNPPHDASQLLGLFITLGAIPRIVAGPLVLVIEIAAFFLIKKRLTRMLLAAATLMDLIPMCIFALHMARATHG